MLKTVMDESRHVASSDENKGNGRRMPDAPPMITAPPSVQSAVRDGSVSPLRSDVHVRSADRRRATVV